MVKGKSLGLAIKFIDGKVAAQMKVEGLNQFEVMGLLMFQILTTFETEKTKQLKRRDN